MELTYKEPVSHKYINTNNAIGVLIGKTIGQMEVLQRHPYTRLPVYFINGILIRGGIVKYIDKRGRAGKNISLFI